MQAAKDARGRTRSRREIGLPPSGRFGGRPGASPTPRRMPSRNSLHGDRVPPPLAPRPVSALPPNNRGLRLRRNRWQDSPPPCRPRQLQVCLVRSTPPARTSGLTRAHRYRHGGRRSPRPQDRGPHPPPLPQPMPRVQQAHRPWPAPSPQLRHLANLLRVLQLLHLLFRVHSQDLQPPLCLRHLLHLPCPGSDLQRSLRPSCQRLFSPRPRVLSRQRAPFKPRRSPRWPCCFATGWPTAPRRP